MWASAFLTVDFERSATVCTTGAQSESVRMTFLICASSTLPSSHPDALLRLLFLSSRCGCWWLCGAGTRWWQVWLHDRCPSTERRDSSVCIYPIEPLGLLKFLKKSRRQMLTLCNHRKKREIPISRRWNWGKQSFVSVWLWVNIETKIHFDPQETLPFGLRQHRHMSHGKVLLVASGRSEGDKVETQHASCNFSCTKLGWFLAYEGATKWVNILKNLFKSLENYHRYQIIIIKKTQTKVTTKNTQTTVQNKYSSIALRVA